MTTEQAVEESGDYPVSLEAELDAGLSRGLWLVKWLFAVPHVFVLFFLWIGFIVSSVVAWFAIVFTGRYPRGIFDFNIGVLRWTWRVEYYAFTVLGTDRYPPFTLQQVDDYPARIEIPYPERLSRGLPLVKWLLAVPHFLVVGIFRGGFQTGGLNFLLVIYAAIALLFTGRYPRDLFDLNVGMSRWGYRVIAYAGLMRDEYPPFRLGR